MKQILIIDDEANMRHMLSVMLKKYGYTADTAADGYEGLEKIKTASYDFILCDIKMPKMSGMDFLQESRQLSRETTIIMMSAYGTIDMAVEAMKKGAYDFISKPFKNDEIRLAIKKAEERNRLKEENQQLKQRIKTIEEKYNFGNMVAKSKKMQELFKLASKVAQYTTTVLITGESGTGKELVARGIHLSSPRADKPFIPINCGEIPENLLESELFGHIKGAFTGADRNKKGLFAEAQNGTVFLDEIGELPMSLQVKLLRVLQESEIRPVGAAKPQNIDTRIIAATSKQLQAEISRGNFREDLFYRLNVLPIQIPPLRERSEDIPLLSRHFVNKFNKIMSGNIHDVAPGAMTWLLKYEWPGNVRELENVIERAMVLAEEEILIIDNFPPEIGQQNIKHDINALMEGYSLKIAQKNIEKLLIKKALNKTSGNRTQSARLLEISHPSLLSKMKAYGLS